MGGDRRRGRDSFEGKCGASHCNQWGLCDVSAASSGDTTLPKLLWELGFLVICYGEDRQRWNVSYMLLFSVLVRSLQKLLRTFLLPIT